MYLYLRTYTWCKREQNKMEVAIAVSRVSCIGHKVCAHYEDQSILVLLDAGLELKPFRPFK